MEKSFSNTKVSPPLSDSSIISRAGGLWSSSALGSLKTINDINKWWITGSLITTTCLLSLAHISQESEKAGQVQEE